MQRITNYLIIGNGRVAKHLCNYLSLLDIGFANWHRGDALERLKELSSKASHILILISDNSIEKFIANNLKESSAIKIHFSGALNSDMAYGAHPLMSFNEGLYDLERYKKIPFVIDDDAPAFEELMPKLPNIHVRLSREMKAKYHALCVLSGNFSCILWQKFFSSLDKEFNFPQEIGKEYLKQQTQNLLEDYKSALTGPLVRGDVATINKNLEALKGDPFKDIYENFVKVYSQIKGE